MKQQPPLPEIVSCIVCDAIRMEAGNKLTIAGFYGLTPADLVVGKIGESFDVMFLFVAHALRANATFELTTQITDPGDKVIARSSMTVQFLAGKQGYWGQGFLDLAPEEEGAHVLSVSAHDKDMFHERTP